MEEMSYEKAISRLEEIVRQLEDASTPLETAMELFKEGMALSKFCNDKAFRNRRRNECFNRK